jgi:natural product biosynthesis luciferase-like monooxygenase protein
MPETTTTLTNNQIAQIQARLRSLNATSQFAPEQYSQVNTLPDLSVIFFSGLSTDDAPYDLLLQIVRYVDQAGFKAIWMPERHFTEVGGAYPNPSVLAAALATMTQHVRLRAGSVNLPLHDPLRVAEEWSMVDNLSNGRVGIGVAPGWHIRDFVLKPENFVDKFNILNVYRDQLQRIWRGEPVERVDANGDTHSIVTFPRPVQKELSIWLTTSQREEPWRFAGSNGFNVLSALINFGPKELEKRIALYREARAAAGYDPKAGIVSLMLHTYVAVDYDQAIERVRPALTQYLKSFVGQHQGANLAAANDKVKTLQGLGTDSEDFVSMVFDRYIATSSLIGDLRHVGETLARFRAMGVDEVACLADFGLDKATVIDSLRLLSALIPR